MTAPAGSPTTPAIETRDLTKRYRETTAVDGLSLRVERGEVFGFLGRGAHDYFKLDDPEDPIYRGTNVVKETGYLTDLRRGEKNQDVADNRVRNIQELLDDLQKAAADIPPNAEAWDRLLKYVREHGTAEMLLRQSA